MATVDFRSSAVEDPFADSSLLFLLPRTLGVPLHAEAAPSEPQEMKSIEDLFGSIILNGSQTDLEQAQAICNGGREVEDSSQVGEKMISPGGKDGLLGRRPALGRKRPKFSLKPILSDSIPDVDFNSQIDHLDDPEEYFMAFDQLENADKELKKLRGVIPTEHPHNQNVTGRKRRPGILGKTASYKHQPSSMVEFSLSEDLDRRTALSLGISTSSKSNENSSDQACNLDSIDPNNQVSVATEQEDSAGDKENNVNNILEKLLCSFKDLDEAEGTALLKESLQIKPIELGKICLPELENIQRNGNRALKDGVVRKKLEVHRLKQNSPTIARSPLAALSNLKRHISVNDPLENPYLNFPSDGAPDDKDFSPTSCQQKRSLSPTVEPEVSYPDPNGFLARDTSISPVSDSRSLSLVEKLQTPVTKTDKIVDDKIAAEGEETELGHQLHESTTIHSLHEVTECSEGFNKHIEDKAEEIKLDQLYDHPDPEVGDLATCCINNNGLASTLGITDDDHVISGEDNADACGIVDISQTKVNVGTTDISPSGVPHKENSTHPTTVLPLDEQRKGVCISAGDDVEKHGCATSGISQNNRKSQKAPSRRKKKNLQILVSESQSLDDAGMKWESGVRRSTRKTFRPLEYWRGERLLYGRIHDSLATVIGVKYSSPGQGGRMKVKSYVSEQYADLVAQAARH